MKCDDCAGRVFGTPGPAEGTVCDDCGAEYKIMNMSSEDGYGKSVKVGLWLRPTAIDRLRESIDRPRHNEAE